MTWIQSLNLPDATAVNLQLKLIDLIRATTPTRADERLLRDAVEQLTIKASLKPATCNISTLCNDHYQVVEVLVIEAVVKPTYLQHHVRLARLINAIPHPLLLWLTDGSQYKLVLQDKRVNQADTKRRTGGQLLASPLLPADPVTISEITFRQLQDFQQQDRLHLKALYDSYLQALLALVVTPIVGTTTKRNPLRAQQDLDTWDQLLKLQSLYKKELSIRYYSTREQEAQNERVRDLNNQISQLIALLKTPQTT